MKRTAVALGVLFAIDLGLIGQGIFSLLIAFGGTALLGLGALWAVVRGQRRVAGGKAARAAIYFLLGAATVGALFFHSYTARTRATRVIEASRVYKAKHGRLPERLQDLVPECLPSVPRAKYAYLLGEFTYWASPGGTHTLVYVTMPPFSRRLYHFEEDRWSTLD